LSSDVGYTALQIYLKEENFEVCNEALRNDWRREL
jgi:hypothetical protein